MCNMLLVMYDNCGKFLRHFYKEVNGLQNSEVAVMITSTGSRTNEYLRSRIVPSIRTWMKDFVNVYVILEDTTDIRFAFRHCKFLDSPRFIAFSCPNEIKYILTRSCTNEYYIGNHTIKISYKLSIYGTIFPSLR